MMRARRGVVRQPVQRIVDALRGERRQRARLAGRGSKVPLTISSSVPSRSGTSNRSRSGRLIRSAIDAVDMRAFGEGEMERDRRRRFRDRDRHAVIAHDQAELLDEIVLEQIGPRDRRGEMPGRGIWP